MNAHQAKIEYARIKGLNVDEVVDTAETMESVRNRQKNFILKVLTDHLEHTVQQIEGTDTTTAESDESIVLLDSIPSSSTKMNGSEEPHKVLCVSHGGYIKHFLKNFCHDLPHVEKISNCSVTIVTVEWVDTSHPERFTCSTVEGRVNISCEDKEFEFI
jgi:broad specificity phosphatase PhoE